MPVSFLTPEQRENYGRYAAPPTADELTRYYHLNDDDLTQIMSCRGEHNRMGFALQLTTVRYLGTFLDDPVAVPPSVLETLSRQLGLRQPRRSANLSVQQATLGTHHQNSRALRLQRHDRTPGRLSPDALALRFVLDRNRAAKHAL